MFSIIGIKKEDEWDKIVKSFKEYDVYYLSGYSKAFMTHGDGDPVLFYYEDGNIRAINAVMKRDISNDAHFQGSLPEESYFDITTPYGYGGFLVEGETTQDSLRRLAEEYTALCQREGIISEFVRFHPVIQNHNNLDEIYEITRLGKTISMHLKSREQIWADMTSKNRNMVRKAQKAGVEIFWGRSPELYKEFKNLYDATMKKDNAKAYYFFGEEFYNSVLNDIKNNEFLFYAVHLGKIIAMAIILFANNRMHYHLSGSDIEYRHLAPNNLLLFEAACWGCEIGHKSFHLGGGLGSEEDALYKFKSGFNRNSDNSFFVGKKIFDDAKYQHLVVTRKTAEGIDTQGDIDRYSGYFPKYRAGSAELKSL